jgi:hypothetical protein
MDDELKGKVKEKYRGTGNDRDHSRRYIRRETIGDFAVKIYSESGRSIQYKDVMKRNIQALIQQ